MVIQRNRRGGQTDFNRNWVDYEEGFGNLQREFWYGLKKLYCLTQYGQWEMRIDFQHAANEPFSFIHYTHFSIGNTIEGYPLMVGGYTGTGNDQFFQQNMMRFATQDNDVQYLIDPVQDFSVLGGGMYDSECSSRDINLNRLAPNVFGPSNFAETKICLRNCMTA